MTTTKKINALERKAMNIVKAAPTKTLLEVWEKTTDENKPETPMVRGWIMEELERRYPEAYNEWLDGDAEDSTLRDYIMAA